MIKVEHIIKSFGNRQVLFDINFEIKERLIIGLVGNNGAGKTTLINTLLGITAPSKGSVKNFGQKPIDSAIVASNSILVDEKMSYDPFLNLDKIIEKFQTYVENFDKFRCYMVLEKFGLSTKRYYGRLSKGMKNQFNIAIGLGCGKDITIFDEPVAGLDELARDKFYEIIMDDYKKEPKLLIISTHLLNEMQDITSKLIVMRGGKVIVVDETEKIGRYFTTITGNYDKIAPLLVNRKIYVEEKIMSVASYTVDNNFTDEEMKYINEQGIEFVVAKANQACKILCNMEWHPRNKEE